jgi:hypothetical protein
MLSSYLCLHLPSNLFQYDFLTQIWYALFNLMYVTSPTYLILILITPAVPYLYVDKPHFFDKNLPSKIGVWLIHGMLCFPPPRKTRSSKGKKSHYPIDDWAREAGIVYCETPVDTVSVWEKWKMLKWTYQELMHCCC